jgi:sugar phosphate isomerase/epimerase
MKLAISNFAWDYESNQIVFDILNSRGLDMIEGVLTKIDRWDNITDEKIILFKKLLDNNKIKMKSIQSIFYGVDCDGFHDSYRMSNHIDRVVNYCKILGVETLVLGSPALRKNVDNLETHLNKTFNSIDDILKNTGITLIIEPNAKSYGGDYFFTCEEIIKFINKFNYKNIKTMIDTHNSKLENKNPVNEFNEFKEHIKHIHFSEVGLIPIQDKSFFIEFKKVLIDNKYKGIITYELIKPENFDLVVNDFCDIF